MFLENLPNNPGELVQRWLDDARSSSGQENWNVMMLATVSGDGRPSVRAVLLKEHDAGSNSYTFFTNFRSRKARDMEANGSVAAAMYWDALHRQIRIEGPVVMVSEAVSDAYFASRPRESQIGAWASEQSEPIENYDELMDKVRRVSEQYEGRPVPRPPHWGGYRIAAERIEFWHGRPGRIHERVRYVRHGRDAPTWMHQWLNP